MLFTNFIFTIIIVLKEIPILTELGGVKMAEVVDCRDILTTREARSKYSKNYIGFITTEQNLENPDFCRGYVEYLFTSEVEGLKLASELRSTKRMSILRGYGIYEPIEIGGIEVTWQV
jgi:hypothetical protein